MLEEISRLNKASHADQTAKLKPLQKEMEMKRIFQGIKTCLHKLLQKQKSSSNQRKCSKPLSINIK